MLAAVNIVVGELAPKRLAMQYAQRWALLVAVPLDMLATFSKPMVWMLGKATDILVRLLGGNPEAAAEQLSPEELRELVAAHRGLTADQREMISGALEINERVLREILIARRAVVMLSSDMSVEAARTVLVESGHSRAPVVHARDLDEVVGVFTFVICPARGPPSPTWLGPPCNCRTAFPFQMRCGVSRPNVNSSP